MTIQIQYIMHSRKTIIRRVSQAVFALLFTMAVNGVAYGQMQDESVLLGMTEFTIKPGHDTKFMEGVKAWKTCYLKNEGTWNWDVWSRLQGEENVYVLSFFSEDWDVFDETDEARQSCRGIARELIHPHLESSKYLIARSIPAISNSNPMNTNARTISVTYWNVNNSTEFREAVNEFHNTMKEKEEDISGYWFNTIGSGPLERWATLEIDNGYWFSSIVSGPDSFNYMSVLPYRNFTRTDEAGPDVWDEIAEGKIHSDKTKNIYRESVDKVWSYAFTWVEDLSRPKGYETASE
jgi:hypothetical protein